ncbi:scarecrow-like protein 6 [Bidens hawaiensis]|uniref:scarecrow-like protein 6 n=1 Tax=Bidens hawaiensis TaxID=980011 RepID=UPI0040495F8D
MPLPFAFEDKGVVDLVSVVPYANPLVHFQQYQDLVKHKKRKHIITKEPTSVLDNITTSPSPPASTTTTLSHGGADTAGVAAALWAPPENQETTNTSNAGGLDLHHHPPPPPLPVNDWENPDSGQDQAMLRWIMGDVEDPSIGLNKLLTSTAVAAAPAEYEFSGGFGSVDQGFISLDSGNNHVGNLPENPPAIFNNHQQQHQNQIFSPLTDTQMLPFDIKPNLYPMYNPVSLEYNASMNKNALFDSGPNPSQNPLQFLQKQSSVKTPINNNQGLIDQLFKAADLLQSTNPILAQGILARLNHQLSPIGKPFERAAFYFKEALNLLLQSLVININNNNNNNIIINPQIAPAGSPFNLIFKIGAYKSFSEVSPLIQFANFTCNQAILESLNGFDQIHLIDFDIGFGGQWASLMQELALRSNGVGYIKITAFVSPSTHDQLELGLTRENLIHFANEINVGFEFEIVNIDVLVSNSWGLPFHVSDNEAVAVNLPVHVFSNHQTQAPAVLRFVKSLSPKIVVSVDRGCDRTDLPFSNHVIHALQSYSNLLESLDAVNVGVDSLQKIERFLVQPAIEKIVLGRFVYPEKTQHWRNLFLSAGFSPLIFSNFTESQAECLVKRTPVREFHVEKRHSLLVLCWQRRELVSVSAWKC